MVLAAVTVWVTPSAVSPIPVQKSVGPCIRPLAAAAVLVATFLVSGCGKERAGRAEAPDHHAEVSASRQPQVDAPPSEVVGSTANPGTLEILSVLSVEQEVDLLAQHDGVVSEIVQEEGSPVDKGTVLAHL